MYENNLADWYRAAGVQPEEDKLPKRIAAIKGFEANANQVISLAKFFYGLGEPSADFLSQLRDVFREQDTVFSNQGNEAELAILAGAKLVQLMFLKSANTTELATLAVACASCQGLQKNPIVPQIPEIAFKRLGEQSKERAHVFAEKQASVFPAEPEGAEETTNSIFGKQFAKMQSDVRIVTEESNMLWWLFAEHSRDENRRWEELPFPASLLKIGKELANLVEILPGPPSAMAFLDRICRQAKSKLPDSVGIKSSVNGLESDWKKAFCEKSFVQETAHLTPITNGIQFSLLASGDGNWAPVFLGATKIDPESALPPQKLCLQIYLEVLLTRAWNQSL